MEEGPEQRPSPGAAEGLEHLACSRGGQAVGTSRGRGRGGEQGCREGHTGKVPLEGQKGAGARRWDTRGEMAQAPTEVVLEVGVPSCFTGGEGPSPALSPPPPCEGRSSNSGAQVAPRPWGINLSLSHEETKIPPPCAPGQHTPTPPNPTEGADARSLTPWSQTGTGTLQPKSRSSGVKGRRPSAGCPQATETGGGSIRRDKSRAFCPSRGPRVPSPSPPTTSFLPRPLSLAVVAV